jgi:hypothetical protein
LSYASGKHAFGYCDRTGFRYPKKDLVPQIVNLRKTGLLVGRDVVDPDQPQLQLGRVRTDDPQALKKPKTRPVARGKPQTVCMEPCWRRRNRAWQQNGCVRHIGTGWPGFGRGKLTWR